MGFYFKGPWESELLPPQDSENPPAPKPHLSFDMAMKHINRHLEDFEAAFYGDKKNPLKKEKINSMMIFVDALLLLETSVRS